nr:putative retrotransposon Ty1-copia subclass protein [Tanacetum cinerariifolium]
KKTRKPFPHRIERATVLLGIIHTDAYGLLRHVSRQETAARILNIVSIKKVYKTPYELWYGKVPNLSYLKEISRRAEELEEIQDEDTSPSENTSDIPIEVEGFEPPQKEVVPIRRYARTHRAPDRLYSESNKWVNDMNAEMQSMKDNQVWHLVDLPPNCKTIGSKWLFKKKTDVDGNVHTYKARLVAKGFTQTYGVDHEETFSPVADIRAIRILIVIAAFYDYEIWKIDVKLPS